MPKHVKLGDQLEVVFAPAYRGAQTEELINGRRAFALDCGPTPLPGDRWEVMVVSMNKARTVYFVEPLNIVEAADGLGEVLKPFAPFYHEYIREAEAELALILSQVGSGEADYSEDALDEAIAEVLSSPLLPEAYKKDARIRFEQLAVSGAATFLVGNAEPLNINVR